MAVSLIGFFISNYVSKQVSVAVIPLCLIENEQFSIQNSATVEVFKKFFKYKLGQ